jgi:hypothetical protein
MAFIPVPGVAQLTLHGVIGNKPWNVITHFLGSPVAGSWTTNQLVAMGNALMSGMASVWGSHMPTATTWSNVIGVDLGTQTPQEGISTHAPITGTSTQINDAASCVLVSYTTNQRFRGGHPRSYFPGFDGLLQTTETLWDVTSYNSFVSAWASAIIAANQAAVSAGAQSSAQCVPLYVYEYRDNPTKKRYDKTRTALKTIAMVTSVGGNNTIATQRRRLR